MGGGLGKGSKSKPSKPGDKKTNATSSNPTNATAAVTADKVDESEVVAFAADDNTTPPRPQHALANGKANGKQTSPESGRSPISGKPSSSSTTPGSGSKGGWHSDHDLTGSSPVGLFPHERETKTGASASKQAEGDRAKASSTLPTPSRLPSLGSAAKVPPTEASRLFSSVLDGSDDDDDDPFGRASTKAATSASAAKDGKGAPTGGGRGSPLVNGKAAVQPQRQLQSVVTVSPSDAPARARAPIGSSAAAKPAEGMAHMLAHLTAQSDAPDGREPKARQSCAAPSSEPALPPPKPKSGFDGDWLDERSSSMPVDSEVTYVSGFGADAQPRQKKYLDPTTGQWRVKEIRPKTPPEVNGMSKNTRPIADSWEMRDAQKSAAQPRSRMTNDVEEYDNLEDELNNLTPSPPAYGSAQAGRHGAPMHGRGAELSAAGSHGRTPPPQQRTPPLVRASERDVPSSFDEWGFQETRPGGAEASSAFGGYGRDNSMCFDPEIDQMEDAVYNFSNQVHRLQAPPPRSLDDYSRAGAAQLKKGQGPLVNRASAVPRRTSQDSPPPGWGGMAQAPYSGALAGADVRSSQDRRSNAGSPTKDQFGANELDGRKGRFEDLRNSMRRDSNFRSVGAQICR